MTHLDKLVAHTVWANGEWITFAGHYSRVVRLMTST